MRLRNILFLFLVLSSIALYMLSVATGVTSKLSEYFWWIFCVNISIVGSLLLVLMQQLWRLMRDIKNGIFGAKLSQSLMIRFALVTVLPSLFLFLLSTQFIVHSINSWFGDGTREALDRSLNLAKVALDNFLMRIMPDARLASLKIKYGLSLQQPFDDILLSMTTDLSKFDQVSVMTTSGEVIITDSNPNKLPWPYFSDLDWSIITNNPIHTDTNIIEGQLYAELFLHIYPEDNRDYIVFFRKQVPNKIALDVQSIQLVHQNYAELTYHKQGLQIIFILTLLVATLLAILISLLAAVFFSRRFISPLISLSDSAQAVASGDFSKKNSVIRDDELGQLSTTFNYMMDQLILERELSNSLYDKQKADHAYLENLLFNLTTGVITLDAAGYIKTYNASAESILKFSLRPYLDTPWPQWSSANLRVGSLQTFIHQLLEQLDGNSLEFNYCVHHSTQVLLGKVATLKSEEGIVMVFDDVTKLVLAQKEAAWGEVARRFAHEIKNPLTPIQLSAERIQRKLLSKMDAMDSKILKKSTNTIIAQVEALKDMVESFRDYARARTVNLMHIDFNELVREVLLLYEGSDCILIDNLSNVELPVHVDSVAIRQVLHNVFKNALEAAKHGIHPEILVKTEVMNNKALLMVCNNGKAFSSEIIQYAFDPYVTDKAGGTGLGLAVVKKIIDEHAGTVTLFNQKKNVGACIQITLNLVSER